MCIGCRKKRKKEEMLRLVKGPDGVLLWNGKKNPNGRGYYLCADRICLKLAQKKQRGLESFAEKDPLVSSIEEGVI
jgi:predicted RNA-binding protein YlxR (DUF448 family)